MARKGWQSLSPGYRARLEKAGISQGDYDGGQSLQSARGHKNTPESPRSYDPNKYTKYHQERTKLERDLAAKLDQVFGHSPSWSASKSNHNIREHPPSLKQIRWALNASEEELLDAIREDTSQTEYRWLHYH